MDGVWAECAHAGVDMPLGGVEWVAGADAEHGIDGTLRLANQNYYLWTLHMSDHLSDKRGCPCRKARTDQIPLSSGRVACVLFSLLDFLHNMSDQSQPLLPRDDGGYLREECDHLLLTATHTDEEENVPLDADGLLGNTPAASAGVPAPPPQLSEAALRSQRRTASFVRILALLCACSLSIGSH